MSYTIDIDVGSTFTNGMLMGDGRLEWVKVDTTAGDLALGVTNCLNEAVKKFGFKDSADLLRQTDIVRLSSSISINTLTQKTGVRVGLIVSKGYETTVYHESGNRPPVLSIVPPDMVMGVKGYIDDSGNIGQDIDDEETRKTVKELLLKGARVLVVSVLNSALNLSLENKIKDLIASEYPPHYLGAITVFTSTEVSLALNDALRTNAAVLNAYVHREMIRFLNRAEDNIRNLGYRKNVFIINNWGGLARVGKTRAIDTFRSGSTSVLCGAASLSKLYKMPAALAFEAGSTSAYFGMTKDGKCALAPRIEIEGIPLEMPAIDVKSVNAAGCSIARVSGGQLSVGPQSAGIEPGPVCFGKGGTEPTVIDAYVVLGYINPDYFHGGQRKLKADQAYNVIKEKIAQPLRIGVEEAAYKIHQEVQAAYSKFARQYILENNIDAGRTPLFSVGGGGGLCCCELVQAAGFEKVYIPPFAAVFEAYGSSTVDLTHQYEMPLPLVLRKSPLKYLSDYEIIGQAVQEMQERAELDIRVDGFTSDKTTFALELKLRPGSKSESCWLPAPAQITWGKEDIKAICEKLDKIYGPSAVKEITLLSLRLTVSLPLVHQNLPVYPSAGASAEAARKGNRKVFWDKVGFKETPVFERKLLKPGNVISGPGIVEEEDTVILIPQGRRFSVDKYLFGIIDKE